MVFQDEEQVEFVSPKKKIRENFFIDILQTVIVALTISVIIYLVIAIPNQVEGQSMEPNFYDKELLLTDKVIEWFGDSQIAHTLNLDYDYERGDVIIFHYADSDLIKRVIAKGGDTIKISDNKVYINGRELDEKYIPTTTRTRLPSSQFALFNEDETVTVPEGKYFLMGDNRESSKDSRFKDIGFISRNEIKGRVFFRYWPISKFGIIRRGEYREITINNS